MRSILTIIFFSQLFFNCNQLFGVDGIVKNSLKMFASKNQNLEIEEISTTHRLDFCPQEKCRFDAHLAHFNYWVYCEIENEKKTPFIFDAHFFYYDITAYYFTDDMTLIDSVSAGNNISVNQKMINTSSNAFTVPIEQKLKCFIRFKTSMPAGIHFPLLDFKDFTNEKVKEHTFYGIINGIFLLAIIYSVLFAVLLWNRIYIYYMFYVSFLWVFMLSINHDTPFYLSWLNIPFGQGYYKVPQYLFTIFLVLYTDHFLQLKTRLSSFSKINTVIIVILLLCLIAFIISGWAWHDDYLNKAALLPSFIASVILIRKQYKPAWFILLGITLIYFAFFSIKFHLARFMPVFYTFSIYGIIEIILFGISISYWIKSLASDNEKALIGSLSASKELALIKQNQNILLEKEVDAKTLALKNANLKLEQSYHEIEKLNKYLENDNDTLKVKVSDQIKARSEDRLMSYQDFKQNFPDEDSCFKHIENIKWARGFVCLKCKSTTYSEKKILNNKSARKCTKCGFINTITAYTLYHNIKFPLQKAFYITYMIGTDKSKTLEELSKELDLRMATIHSFLKKVKEARTAYKSTKKHKDGWTQLMLYHIKENTTAKNLSKEEE